MTILGSSSDWSGILEDILPTLLQSIVDTWDTLKGPLANAREDTITDAFCLALRRNREIRDLPVYAHSQLAELEPEDGQPPGRLDIAFLPTGATGSPDESIYFGLECKVLNVTRNGRKRPQGSSYVRDGMTRFVTKQYAKAVRHGGMVGYVFDGDIPSAIDNVQDNVKRHYNTLKMNKPGVLHPSSVMAHISTARESFHQRNGEANRFCIYHFFFTTEKLF